MKTTGLLVFVLGLFGQLALHTEPNVIAWGDSRQTNVPAFLTNAVAVSAGLDHSLALTSEGTVVGWGLGSAAQVPENVTNIVAIAAGNNFSVALTDQGRVKVWGNSKATNIPVAVTSIVSVAAGDVCAVALRSDSTVFVWGDATTRIIAVTNATASAIESAGSNSVFVLKKDKRVLYSSKLTNSLISNGTLLISSSFFNCFSNQNLLSLRADGRLEFCYIRYNQFIVGKTTAYDGLGGVKKIATSCSSNVIYYTPPTVEESTFFILYENGFIQSNDPNTNFYYTLPFVSDISVSKSSSNRLAIVDRSIPVVPKIWRLSPESQTMGYGSTLTIRSFAVGVPPLSYQWFFGTNEIAGETNGILTINNVQISQSGDYYVRVFSGNGGYTESLQTHVSILPTLDIRLVPTILFQADIGSVHRIEYINTFGPTDAWMYLDQITIQSSPQFYFDVSAIGQPQRFYRSFQIQ